MKKKKSRYKFNPEIASELWLPSSDTLENEVNELTDTWFNSTSSKSKFINKPIIDNIPSQNDTGVIIRSKKIEVMPNRKQKKILKKWSALYRYIYNLTVKYFRNNPDVNKSFQKIRPLIKNSINKTMKDKIKLYKIPSHTIDNAIHDVIKAYKVAFENLKRRNIKYFKLRYKKKKSKRQTMVIESSAFSTVKQRSKYNNMLSEIDKKYEPLISIKCLFDVDDIFELEENKLKNSFCTSVLGNYIRTSESIKYVKNDCRLTYYPHLDKFYMYIPYETNKVVLKDQEGACILDPGCRTFQTGYTTDGVIEIGKEVSTKIGSILAKSDKYNKKRKDNKKYNSLYHKLNTKIDNLVTELHNKTCNYLCNRYKCIVIGSLSTKDTNRKTTSVLNKKTKRILSLLSHTKFRNKLKSKCEEMNILFYEVDEAYTSKTCSNCGYYKSDLGRNKEYRCNNCNLALDRDVNGCRNILIKNHDIVISW